MKVVLCIDYLGHYMQNIIMSSLLRRCCGGLRPTFFLSRNSVLFVASLDLLNSYFLFLCLIEVLILKWLHIGAQLTVRGQ